MLAGVPRPPYEISTHPKLAPRMQNERAHQASRCPCEARDFILATEGHRCTASVQRQQSETLGATLACPDVRSQKHAQLDVRCTAEEVVPTLPGLRPNTVQGILGRQLKKAIVRPQSETLG